MVLAECNPVKGRFKRIGLEIAMTLAAHNHSVTYTCDRDNFTFLVDDGITYLVVAEESLPQEISFKFLARVKNDFRKNFPNWYAAKAHSLDEQFWPIMLHHMTFCDEAASIKNRVIMLPYIPIIEPQPNLEEPVQLPRTTSTLSNNLWWQNNKVKLLVILLILAVVLWLSICHDGSGNNHPGCNQPHLVINMGFRFFRSSIDFY